MDIAGALQFAINIVAENFAVVNRSEAIPFSGRVQQFAIE